MYHFLETFYIKLFSGLDIIYNMLSSAHILITGILHFYPPFPVFSPSFPLHIFLTPQPLPFSSTPIFPFNYNPSPFLFSFFLAHFASDPIYFVLFSPLASHPILFFSLAPFTSLPIPYSLVTFASLHIPFSLAPFTSLPIPFSLAPFTSLPIPFSLANFASLPIPFSLAPFASLPISLFSLAHFTSLHILFSFFSTFCLSS